MAIIDGTPYGGKRGQTSPVMTGFRSVLAAAEEHRERIARYMRYLEFYGGDHWDVDPGAGDDLITLNYVRALTDYLSAWLMKDGFDIGFKEDPDTAYKDAERRSFVKQALDTHWERNQKEQWCLECGQMGGITGDVFLRVSWDDTDPDEEPFARVDILPSQYVFPEFGGPYGVDKKTMVRCTVVNPKYVPASERKGILGFFKRKMIWASEVWTAKEVVFYEDGTETGRRPNVLGEIPIVHIPNLPVPGDSYGFADIVDIISLQEELNDKATDISDVIHYHGSPITVVIGAHVNTLERGANKVWGLPEGSDIKNLALAGDLGASLTHFKDLKNTMFELLGIPEGALGKTQAISNTTGVAIAMQYMPLQVRRKFKMNTYGTGLRRVCRMMLKILELKDPVFGKKFSALKDATPKELWRRLYNVNVTFPSPFPRDEKAELDTSKQRIDLGISTRKRELVRLGTPDADAETIFEEVIAERTRLAEADLAGPLSEPSGPGNPNPVRPSPEIQGDKVSAGAED